MIWLNSNSFKLPDRNEGPYSLRLSLSEGRLLLDIISAEGSPCILLHFFA